MWVDVQAGTCVEMWFNTVAKLGGDVERMKENWYQIWCPAGREFAMVEVPVDIADDCRALERRLRHMTSLRGKI